jgi:hypothetical protein
MLEGRSWNGQSAGGCGRGGWASGHLDRKQRCSPTATDTPFPHVVLMCLLRSAPHHACGSWYKRCYNHHQLRVSAASDLHLSHTLCICPVLKALERATPTPDLLQQLQQRTHALRNAILDEPCLRLCMHLLLQPPPAALQPQLTCAVSIRVCICKPLSAQHQRQTCCNRCDNHHQLLVPALTNCTRSSHVQALARATPMPDLLQQLLFSRH